MKKILLTMLFISSFANADDIMKNTENNNLFDNNYDVVLKNETYKKYMEDNQVKLKELKNKSINETTQNICYINPYYCDSGMKRSFAVEQLNGNLIYPEAVQALHSRNEIYFAVLSDYSNKKSKLYEEYKIGDNEKGDEFLKKEYIPALKNFIDSHTDGFIMLKVLYSDNIDLDKLSNDVETPKMKKVSAKAASIYFEKGENSKNKFIQEQVLKIADENKKEVIEFIEKRKTK